MLVNVMISLTTTIHSKSLKSNRLELLEVEKYTKKDIIMTFLTVFSLHLYPKLLGTKKTITTFDDLQVGVEFINYFCR